MKRKIRITERDIAHGRPSSPTSCPIAYALQREFSPEYVSINRHTLTIRRDNEIFENVFPKAVSNWIKRFDSLKKVKPFTLVLRDLPDSWRKP